MAATAMIEPEQVNPPGDAGDEQDEAPRRSPVRIILWLIAVAIALLLIPLYLVSVTVKDAIPAFDAEITAIAQTLAAPIPISAEQQALEAELLNVRGSVSAIQPPLQSAAAAHINWPETMEVIGSYDPLRVSLTRVTQSGKQITVNGQAVNQVAVTAYADSLREAGLFQRVVILSIDALVLPTATPARTGEVPPFPVTVAEFSLLLEMLPPSTEASNATE